ncbi:S41 family peptidase [Candidatus Microgenomates bacterium]|nr:S41 family peptidase [Candidatus Microgenomates bacterium]
MKEQIRRINIKNILILILVFLLGWQLGHRNLPVEDKIDSNVRFVNQKPPKEIEIDFKLFWDTWDLVSRLYLDKSAIDPNKLFYGAISGMVSAIGDPYTVFLPPEQQKSSKEELNGSFEGVGIQLGFNKEKRLVVVAPLSGTPAEKVGIKPQDLIVKIDDKDTTSMTLPEAVKLIRGPKGTQVTLEIFREGEEEARIFTLTRDTIVVKSVEVSFQNSKTGKEVAIIKLSRFGERTKEEWEKAVSDIISRNPQGLVLDVRNNPGGFLEGAVFIASEFLESGDVVIQENAKKEQSPFKVNRTGRLLDKPMVVVINKGSASASEIVAGALRDRGRAKLVGEKSFGKGTIQEAQDLPGGTGIHITVAKWLTPNGSWVNDTQGLEADVKIESSTKIEEDKVDSTKDPQLDKALELLD